MRRAARGTNKHILAAAVGREHVHLRFATTVFGLAILCDGDGAVREARGLEHAVVCLALSNVPRAHALVRQEVVALGGLGGAALLVKHHAQTVFAALGARVVRAGLGKRCTQNTQCVS